MVLIGLISLSLEASSKFDKNWKNCRTKHDCVQVRGCCGWDAINKKDQKQFEKYSGELCAHVECQNAPDFTNDPVLECRKFQCQTDTFVSKNTESKKACLSMGQIASVGGAPGAGGWNLQPPCCSSLKDRESLSICGKGYGGGYTYVCIACGDKKCDKQFESSCNCPEDCK